MSDNSSRKAKSVYLIAVLSALAPVSAAFGAYGSANSYDLNPAGATSSKANVILGARELGQASISPNVIGELWLGTSASASSINNTYYNAFVLGGSFTQYVGGGDLTSGATDQALLWSVNPDGSIAAPVNLNPSGYGASYANAAFGTQQVGYAFSSTFLNKAFIWSGTAGSGVNVHTLLPSAITNVASSQSYIFATNGTQQVGYAYVPLNGNNWLDHAILWNGTGSPAVDLTPTSGGYQGTYARAIIGNQQFGTAWYDGSDHVHTKDSVHAQVWTGTAASMTDINPSGYVNSNVFGGSATISGNIIVGSGNTSGASEHAIYWTGTTFAADLHSLLPGAPTASRALSVDVYGNISGYAVYSGQNHAVTWLAGNTYKISNGSGAWNSNANWLSGAAPAAGQDVFLLASDAAGANVTFASASPLSLNRLVIDSSANVAVSMSQAQDSLTVANETLGYIGKGAYTQTGGTHAVTGTLTLGANAGASGQYALSSTGALTANNIVINAASALNQTGGTLNATSTLNAGTLNLAGIANVGSLNAVTSGTTSAALSSVGTTSVAQNAAVAAIRLRQNSLTLHGSVGNTSGVLTINESSPGLGSGLPSGDNNAVSIVRSINIDHSGTDYFATLDLKNNDLIIDYSSTGISPLAEVEAMVKSAYNNGTWTGKGITSSIAAIDPSYHLSVADNALLGGTAINSFDDIDTSSHQQVIVKFTWVADINLDGLVNSNDAIAFANYYVAGQTGAHHFQGDLNYDGVIDANDAIIFSNAYNAALPHLPEPSTLGLLSLGALALLKRRRS